MFCCFWLIWLKQYLFCLTNLNSCVTLSIHSAIKRMSYSMFRPSCTEWMVDTVGDRRRRRRPVAFPRLLVTSGSALRLACRLAGARRLLVRVSRCCLRGVAPSLLLGDDRVSGSVSGTPSSTSTHTRSHTPAYTHAHAHTQTHAHTHNFTTHTWNATDTAVSPCCELDFNHRYRNG